MLLNGALRNGTLQNGTWAAPHRFLSQTRSEPMRAQRTILIAGLAAAVSACSATPHAAPSAPPWSINAVATLAPGGAYTVHTVTLAPETCYVASDAAAAPSPLPETIELRITLERQETGCSERASNVEYDFEAAGAGPNDSQVEVIVIADGQEKNRSIVPLAPPRQLDLI
jgi:hypothetical protein